MEMTTCKSCGIKMWWVTEPPQALCVHCRAYEAARLRRATDQIILDVLARYADDRAIDVTAHTTVVVGS